MILVFGWGIGMALILLGILPLFIVNSQPEPKGGMHIFATVVAFISVVVAGILIMSTIQINDQARKQMEAAQTAAQSAVEALRH